MVERRNMRERGEWLARLLRWISQQRTPVRDVPDVVDAAAARRVLATLAIRGLVRRVRDGWAPSPVLLVPVELVPDRWPEARESRE